MMESTKKPLSDAVRNDPDVDLALILYKSGKYVKKMFVSLGKGISGLISYLFITMLFLMRNIVWLLLGTVIGLGYGIYLLTQNGSKYYSDMTIRANNNSATALYNTIDYFNSLIASQNTVELTKILSITAPEAAQLESFYAEPVRSEIITADLYKKHFLTYDRSEKVRQDTFWVKTIKYTDFKESLTKVDYPIHEITLTSNSPTIFPKVQQGFINELKKNEFLRKVNQSKRAGDKEEEYLLTLAIQHLDSLREAYNFRLKNASPASESGKTQLTLFENTSTVKIPELELYDKLLELKDALKKTRNEAVLESDVFEVYSDFNATGRKVSFFKQSVVKYSIIGFFTALLILTGISLNKFVIAFEAKRAAGKRAVLPVNNE